MDDIINKTQQVCSRCVMDTSIPNIIFDEDGVCNYCKEFLHSSAHVLENHSESNKKELYNFVKKVKEAGKNNTYDCVVGVSGGVDSSWTLVKAVELGLRPLVVHMDNGWNSELAQNNIANLVRGLNLDLITYVIDWNEYRSLMQSFFNADVVDVELLYDNAMIAVNYQQANKHNIKYILAGTNKATEGIPMPRDWNWLKHDKKNIKSIAKIHGNVKIESFPAIGTIKYFWFEFVKRIHWVSFLDMLDYKKTDAVKILEAEFGYKPYPYKHYESIFTRLYQGYILPEKFNIDKRRVHLSALVVTGEITRHDALEKLADIPYPSKIQLEQDKKYFLKKMNWEMVDLEDYIKRPSIPHSNYPSERPLWEYLANTYKKVFGQHKYRN